MNELLSLLKEQYSFEIVKNNTTDVIIRCLKPNMVKFASKINEIVSETASIDIKLYHMGDEKQYSIYRIYFVTNTSLDMEKLKSYFENKQTTEK